MFARREEIDEKPDIEAELFKNHRSRDARAVVRKAKCDLLNIPNVAPIFPIITIMS